MCNKLEAKFLAMKHRAEVEDEADREQALSDVLEAADDEFASTEEMVEALGIRIVSCNGSFASVDIGGIRGILIR